MNDRLRAFSGQIIAIGVALLLGAIIILMVGESPVRVLMTLLRGAFGDQEKIAGTLLQTTPILICGVAACIGLRGGMFNVGIEGQLFLGGFAAAWVGFSFSLPAGIHTLAALALAIAAGAAWVAIPAYFRARYNTNEVVSTILSNYIAVLLTSYFTIFLFKRPGGWSETPPILATAYLPEIFSFSRLNWGLAIG
ncbi:ABC transporter permease, partial [Mesorhizobium sp. M2D.F.Ca.ET.145.01.1.1]